MCMIMPFRSLQWYHDVDGELRIMEALDRDHGITEGGCDTTCQVSKQPCLCLVIPAQIWM